MGIIYEFMNRSQVVYLNKKLLIRFWKGRGEMGILEMEWHVILGRGKTVDFGLEVRD